MLGLSRVRFAAGVCLLAAGLLMGGAGGAVAVADPDSSSSAADGDDGTHASGQHSTTASSPGKRETSTLGSGPQPSDRRENHRRKSLLARTPRTSTKTRSSSPRFPIESRRSAHAVEPAPSVVAPAQCGRVGF